MAKKKAARRGARRSGGQNGGEHEKETQDMGTPRPNAVERRQALGESFESGDDGEEMVTVPHMPSDYRYKGKTYGYAGARDIEIPLGLATAMGLLRPGNRSTEERIPGLNTAELDPDSTKGDGSDDPKPASDPRHESLTPEELEQYHEVAGTSTEQVAAAQAEQRERDDASIATLGVERGKTRQSSAVQ